MFNSFLQERQPNSDNIINAKLKINEFFLTWLSKSETTSYINELLSGLNNSKQPNHSNIPSNSNNITQNNNNIQQTPPVILTTTIELQKQPVSSPSVIINNDVPPKIIEPIKNDEKNEINSSNNITSNVVSVKVENESTTIDDSISMDIDSSQPPPPKEIENAIVKENINDTSIEISTTTTIDTSNNQLDDDKVENQQKDVSMSYNEEENKQLKDQEKEQEQQKEDLSDNILKTLDSIDTIIPITNDNIIQQPQQDKPQQQQQQQKKEIPRFYFPKIKQLTSQENLQNILTKIGNRFNNPERLIRTYEEFEILLKDLVSFPKILNRLVFHNLIRQLQQFPINITEELFINYYKSLILDKEPEEVLFHILKKSPDSKYLTYEDFFLFSKTLIETHSSLEFLKNTPEFQDRYQETIIIRIFYCISKNKGKITLDDLLKSNFIKSLSLLDAEPDINKHLEYFSYEHFYVIYCKFWELDSDHDLLIDANDLLKYGNGSLTYRIVERIIDNSIFTKESPDTEERISYQDFVWFILSEEDKNSETSIEFWFKCIDVDCDGVLSLFEMEYFYEEQKQRLDYLNLDPPVFKDLICQILDMIKPNSLERITLRDLKKSRMAGYLFNVLFNITKFLQQESKESISFDQPPMTDWHNFALHEYEKALAEESSSYHDPQEEDDDDDDDDDEEDDNSHNDFIRKRYLPNNIDDDEDDNANSSDEMEIQEVDDDVIDDMMEEDDDDEDD